MKFLMLLLMPIALVQGRCKHVYKIDYQHPDTIRLEGPYSISLTATKVYASRKDTTGDFIVHFITASLEWQAYHNDYVRDYEHLLPYHLFNRFGRQETSRKVAHMAVLPMVNMLHREYNYTQDISIDTVPSIFAPHIDYAFPVYRELGGLHNFQGCKYLGRSCTRCDEYGPDNMVLYLEFEKNYLLARMVFVEFELWIEMSIYDEFCRGCGSDFAEIEGYYTHLNKLNSFMKEFIARHNLYFSESWSPRRLRKEDVRAIVRVGEADDLISWFLENTAADIINDVGTPMERDWYDHAKVLRDCRPGDMIAYASAEHAWSTEKWARENGWYIDFTDIP